MCDRMNMTMICGYLCVSSQNHIVRLLREPTATHSSRSILVSLNLLASFNRLVNATMVTWCAYHVHKGLIVLRSYVNAASVQVNPGLQGLHAEYISSRRIYPIVAHKLGHLDVKASQYQHRCVLA